MDVKEFLSRAKIFPPSSHQEAFRALKCYSTKENLDPKIKVWMAKANSINMMAKTKKDLVLYRAQH
jgi:hypothetical protein